MRKLLTVFITTIMCFGLFLAVSNRVSAEENAWNINDETTLRSFLSSTNADVTEGKLNNDIVITQSASIPVKRTKTLNLNGHTISVNVSNQIGNANSGYSLFDCQNVNGYGQPVFTINANNGTINLNGKGRFFYFINGPETKLTINGGSYKNGTAYQYETSRGGVVLSTGGFLTTNGLINPGFVKIDNAVITGCVASQGGAIAADGAQINPAALTINNTTIKNNKVKVDYLADTYAAGIKVNVASGTVTLKDVTVTNNESEKYAGGIYISGTNPNDPKVILDGKIVITDNIEKVSGEQSSNLYLTNGGLHNARVTIANTFDKVNSRIKVSHNNDDIIVDNDHGASADLLNNFLSDYPTGAEIEYISGTGTSTGLKFKNSSVTNPCSSSTTAGSTCTISNENELKAWAANTNGTKDLPITGRLTQHVGFNQTLEISKTVNVKGHKVLDLDSKTITASSNFSGDTLLNITDEGTDVDHKNYVTIKNGTINGNDKYRGVIVGHDKGSSTQTALEVTLDTIKGINCKAPYGGFVYVIDGYLTLQNSEISNCIASGEDTFTSYSFGGAIYEEALSDVFIKNTNIHDCKSENGMGGAIGIVKNATWSDYPNMTISDNSVIKNNTAYRAGAGIYHDGAVLSIYDTEISNNKVLKGEIRGDAVYGQGAGIYLSVKNFNRDPDTKFVVGKKVIIKDNLAATRGDDWDFEKPSNVFINYEKNNGERRYIYEDTSNRLTSGSYIGVSIINSEEVKKWPEICVAKNVDTNSVQYFNYDLFAYGLKRNGNGDLIIDDITIYLKSNGATGTAHKNSEDGQDITEQLKWAPLLVDGYQTIKYNGSRWIITSFDLTTSKKYAIYIDGDANISNSVGSNTIKTTSNESGATAVYCTGNLHLTDDAYLADVYPTMNFIAEGANNGTGVFANTITLDGLNFVARGNTQAVSVNSEIYSVYSTGSASSSATESSFTNATFNTNTYKVDSDVAKALKIREDYGIILGADGKVYKTKDGTTHYSKKNTFAIKYLKNGTWTFNNFNLETKVTPALTFEADAAVQLNGKNSVSNTGNSNTILKSQNLKLTNTNANSYSYLNVNGGATGIDTTGNLTVENGVVLNSNSTTNGINVSGTLNLGRDNAKTYVNVNAKGDVAINTNNLNAITDNIYLTANGVTKGIKSNNAPTPTSLELWGSSAPDVATVKATYDSGDKEFKVNNIICKYLTINAVNYHLSYARGADDKMHIYKVYPNGQTDLAGDAELKDLGISYDEANKTITLNNTNFVTSNKHGLEISINANDTYKLIVNGNNYIASTHDESTADSKSGGIYLMNGNLEISGGGTLNVLAGKSDKSAGIYLDDGNLSIKNTSVTAYSPDSASASIGIYANSLNAQYTKINAYGGLSKDSSGIELKATTGKALRVDTNSTINAIGNNQAIVLYTNSISIHNVKGNDQITEKADKEVVIADKSEPTETMNVKLTLNMPKLGQVLQNSIYDVYNAISNVDYKTFVLKSDGTTPAKMLTFYHQHTPKPDPGRKDESCEKVIGPTWHWNEKKGICEDTGVVNTFSR